MKLSKILNLFVIYCGITLIFIPFCAASEDNLFTDPDNSRIMGSTRNYLQGPSRFTNAFTTNYKYPASKDNWIYESDDKIFPFIYDQMISIPNAKRNAPEFAEEPLNKESAISDRDTRSPLGTMRFGKRSPSLNRLFNEHYEVKRDTHKSNPLGTMRFGRK